MPYTILYIEDETAIIELLQYTLVHPDIELICVTSVPEGLRLLKEKKPNLLMLDVVIPGYDGWSIHEDIRKMDDFKELPIIMLTGQLHRYSKIKEFQESKLDSYITKPFEIGTVRDEIEKMLGVSIWTNKPKPKKKS